MIADGVYVSTGFLIVVLLVVILFLLLRGRL